MACIVERTARIRVYGARDAAVLQTSCTAKDSKERFLGHVISERCVAVCPRKVAADGPPSRSGRRRRRTRTCAAS